MDSFGMHPMELLNLLESGEGGIAGEYDSEDSCWLFWSREWEFCLEQIDEEYRQFLNHLKSPKRIVDIKALSDYNSRTEKIILEAILEGYIQVR